MDGWNSGVGRRASGFVSGEMDNSGGGRKEPRKTRFAHVRRANSVGGLKIYGTGVCGSVGDGTAVDEID